jgi:hypothetical protein
MVALGVAAVGMAGVAIAQTTPALADPAQNATMYVGVGSDTTQDVMNGLAANLGGTPPTLGSWDAVNPVTGATHDIITPTELKHNVAGSFARPNGSTEGVAALRCAITPSVCPTANPPSPQPQQNSISWARSSSGPGANANTNGQFIYIPFALDALAGSVGPATGGVVGGVNTVPTAITQAGQFTLQNLKDLYASCLPVTVGTAPNTVTYNPNTAGAGQTQIDLYQPQSGSGTRKFWATALGYDPVNSPSCVHDTIVAGALTGKSVEEHDGTAVATDANGFGPFSIAQWIGQKNGHNDRRHGAVLTNVNGISPFDSNGHLNTGWVSQLQREVYNVLPYDRVVNSPGDANFDQQLANVFVGTSSAVCQHGLTIQNYGFATLHTSTPNPTPHNCGDIDQALRAFPNG